jgi:hypothetical protein
MFVILKYDEMKKIFYIKSISKLTKLVLTKSILFGLLVFMAFIFYGCYAQQAVVTESFIPKYDFTPPKRVDMDSIQVTIALISPQYLGKDNHFKVPPYSSLISNLSDDFEELLTAKGFGIKGPFKSHDEMLYMDKQETDFILEVGIKFNEVGGAGWTHRKKLNFLTEAYSYTYYLDFIYEGQLTLTAISPVTKEKIWKKNVTTDPFTVSVQGITKWTGAPTYAQILKADKPIYNEVAQKLESFYNQVFDLAWRHIQAQEMSSIAKQAHQADSK